MSSNRMPHRFISLSTALISGLLLAACGSLPSDGSTSTQGATPAAQQTTRQAAHARTEPQVTPDDSIVTASGTGSHAVVTETLNCVPTKEAQAQGLVKTERVVAAYQVPGEQEAGEASVRLTIDGKTFTLREAPSASGSRYVGGDSLIAGQRGFSWHTKRNEAILSGLLAGGSVDSVIDGPLLYRCTRAASSPSSQ
ncbi:MAG: MliC family protein [Lautropia sp.]|nr:MliC family protein [Lautropia sp.]